MGVPGEGGKGRRRERNICIYRKTESKSDNKSEKENESYSERDVSINVWGQSSLAISRLRILRMNSLAGLTTTHTKRGSCLRCSIGISCQDRVSNRVALECDQIPDMLTLLRPLRRWMWHGHRMCRIEGFPASLTQVANQLDALSLC